MKHMPQSVVLLVPIAVLSVVSGTAVAQDETPPAPAAEPKTPAQPAVDPETPSGIFGTQGQIAISSDVGLSIEHTSLSDDGGSTTRLQLRPALDYFIVDNLSIGGFIALDFTNLPTGDSTTFAIGPRVGYNLPLSPTFSVFPRLGFSFAHVNQTTEVTPDGSESSTSSNGVALNLFAPVMFHPVEHFFLGFGPAFDVDLSGDVRATTIAARLTIGGWL